MKSEKPALKAFSWYEIVTETANAGFIWKYRKGLNLLQGAVRLFTTLLEHQSQEPIM